MRIFAFLTLCFIPFFVNAQCIVSGKVIAEFDLMDIPQARIMTRDTLVLATTDSNGNFKIELPKEIDTLLVSSIGMEWTLIKVPTNCDRLEIIMMFDVIYDFITARKQDRRRYKRFSSLKSKHKLAFDKGIFGYPTPCITYIFQKY